MKLWSQVKWKWCVVWFDVCVCSRDKMSSHFHMIWKCYSLFFFLCFVRGYVYTTHTVCLCATVCHDVKVKEYQAAVKFGHLKIYIIVPITHIAQPTREHSMIYRANDFFSPLTTRPISIYFSIVFEHSRSLESQIFVVRCGRFASLRFFSNSNKSHLIWCGNFNCWNNTTNSQLTKIPFVFRCRKVFKFLEAACLIVIFIGNRSESVLFEFVFH